MFKLGTSSNPPLIAPLPLVQKLGHGNPAITRHYFHSDESAARKAIAAIPSLLQLPEPDAELAALRAQVHKLVDAADAETLKAMAYAFKGKQEIELKR